MEYHQDEKKKQYAINNVLTTAFILFGAVAIIGCLLSPVLVKIIAPYFKGALYGLAVRLTVILFSLITFTSLSALIAGTLQTYGRFVAAASIDIPNNLIWF